MQQVTNNLFLSNDSMIGGSAAELAGGQVGGIYSTNNTVASNTASGRVLEGDAV